MSKTTEWQQIMAGLRGPRLAVYDDLMNARAVAGQDLKVQELLGWLVYHRFIWHDGQRYVPREIPAARDLWASEGAAGKEAADVARQAQVAAVETTTPAPERPAVHQHQPQLFADV